MKARMRRDLVMVVAGVASALTLLATMAAGAMATVPGGLVDGQGQNIGRGGGFTVTTLSGWSALDVLGGLAVSAAAVALVAWLGISSDRRARAQLALAPGVASREAAKERAVDRERKAA